MLVSRDEQSCLVVSYKELKACVESAFRWDRICGLIAI
jgi:PAB-dependent poly(A)-specific ribonuclease subunit 3